MAQELLPSAMQNNKSHGMGDCVENANTQMDPEGSNLQQPTDVQLQVERSRLSQYTSNSTGPTKVLVADDNAVDRRLLTAIVQRAGYEVVNAVNGIDALEKFHQERPGLVLLDALMPGKDGFAVAEEIKAVTRDNFVPIIFLTSLTDANELARCVEAGGDDFLSKPYNQVILRAKLNALDRMREMHATVQSQRDEISKHHMQMLADQEAAKAVFDNIAHSRHLNAGFIKHLLSPLALFNGDVLLAAQNPAKNLYLMLGDFTGHGLAAAIGALPLSDVFYGMTAKGFNLAEVVKECNKKLCTVLPSGYFCCATSVYLDFSRKTVEIWNGGLPSVYLRRSKSPNLIPLESQHLPLGILSPERFSSETIVYEVNTGDRLFLATDGVIEARNKNGAYFGSDKLEDIVGNVAPDKLFDEVKTAVYAFMQEEDRDDDITMVEVEVVDEGFADSSIEVVGAEDGPQDWKLSYELGPDSLKVFNPLPLLQQILMEAPYLRAKGTEIYTVLAELYSNALEHGVMGLDSKLKNSADGFVEYYKQRALALENLGGWIRFNFDARVNANDVELKVMMTDSGPGFDFAALTDKSCRSNTQNKGYHGRGLALLHELCCSVEYQAPGNCVEVYMRWENGDV